MVLDTIENNTFVFKNTYEKEKQVEIPMDHDDAPDEFFFVHIKFFSLPWTTRLSCASMLQTSCVAFIRQCHEQGLFNGDKKEDLEQYITDEWVQSEIRNLMVTLVQEPLDKYGDCQAYLREMVSNVRQN